MITLPSSRRPHMLAAFWLATSLSVGMLIGMIGGLALSPRWLFFGLGAAVVMAVPGFLRPQIAAFPYRAWNKLAREFSRGARHWLTGICYYVILVAVGQTKSSIKLMRPTPQESFWVARLGRTVEHTPHFDGSAGEPPRRGWIRPYASWAVQSGNAWALGLLPFVVLLSALEVDQQENPLPADIYTLF